MANPIPVGFSPRKGSVRNGDGSADLSPEAIIEHQPGEGEPGRVNPLVFMEESDDAGTKGTGSAG